MSFCRCGSRLLSVDRFIRTKSVGVSNVIMPTAKVNPDLVKERSTASFVIEEFAEWWAGGKQRLDAQRSLLKTFFDDPEFDDVVNVSYLSHVELYEYAVKKGTKFIKRLREVLAVDKSLAGSDEISALYNFRSIIGGPLGAALFPQNNPFRLHYSMFLTAIVGQGTDEQRAEWLPRGWRCEILGTYAQTELGHGTNVRGLETRADYDRVREEFVLNTPTLTSYKWWPGNLGHTSNYVVLMAQLYVGDKNHGVHPFILQVRDLETHMPMAGVEVGEIGPKLGINAVNNGYLGLKDVRIPRMQMLMRNATLHSDGTFKRSGDQTLTYGTMVFVRVMIVRDASVSIIQAATIATRYSAIRRQSPINPNEPEPQIMDHVTQQMKVFPQIAKGIFYKLAADHVWDMYRQVMADLAAGKGNGLPELHALSCCLKAVSSVDALAAVEVLRMSCGGHGFITSSNFPSIYGNAAPACIYEGETTVVLLQTARFLMKSWKDVLMGKQLAPSVAYLVNYKQPVQWNRSIYTCVDILQSAAANKIQQTHDFMEQKLSQGHSQQTAANLCGIRLCQAAALHARAFLAGVAYEQIKVHSKNVSPELSKILWNLLELYLLDMILNNLADVLNFVALSREDVASIQLRFETLLAWMRPNAVGIVDGFDLHDRVLNSTLGAYDGLVYQRLMDEAKKSPLNQEPVNKSYQQYLAPFMKGKL